MIEESVMQLNDADFETATAEGVTLVDFWAPWCGPCRMMGPVLDELAEDFSGQAKITRVNVDESPVAAGRFRIQAIPLFVLLKDGKEVDRSIGVQPADAIKEMIRRHL